MVLTVCDEPEGGRRPLRKRDASHLDELAPITSMSAEYYMNRNDRLLSICSILTILLFSIHMSDDVVRGYEPRGLSNLPGLAIMAVWLSATLLLVGRRTGYVVILLGSLLCCLFPIAHLRGADVTTVVATPGGHFFVWTLFAIGVLAASTATVAAVCLWGTRRTMNAPGRM